MRGEHSTRRSLASLKIAGHRARRNVPEMAKRRVNGQGRPRARASLSGFGQKRPHPVSRRFGPGVWLSIVPGPSSSSSSSSSEPGPSPNEPGASFNKPGSFPNEPYPSTNLVLSPTSPALPHAGFPGFSSRLRGGGFPRGLGRVFVRVPRCLSARAFPLRKRARRRTQAA